MVVDVPLFLTLILITSYRSKAVNAKVAEVLSGQAGAIRKSPVVPGASGQVEPQILDFDYEEEPEDDADSEPEPEPEKAPVGAASAKRNANRG